MGRQDPAHRRHARRRHAAAAPGPRRPRSSPRSPATSSPLWPASGSPSTITIRAMTLMTALALLFAAGSGLIPRRRQAPIPARIPILSAFILCLAAEMGDRTQFLTFALAGRFDSAPLAAAGATAGILAACIPAAMLGERLADSGPGPRHPLVGRGPVPGRRLHRRGEGAAAGLRPAPQTRPSFQRKRESRFFSAGPDVERDSLLFSVARKARGKAMPSERTDSGRLPAAAAGGPGYPQLHSTSRA